MKGGKLIYSLNLSNSVNNPEYDILDQPILQLNFFSYIQYLHNCPVSKSVLKYEQVKRRDYQVPQNISLNTAEAAAGIEIRINLTKSISLRNCIALSVYTHLNKNMNLIFHERSAINLNLSTGLNFVIN